MSIRPGSRLTPDLRPIARAAREVGEKPLAEADVMTITLNRVERKNSITSDMYGAMADALERDHRVSALRGAVTAAIAGLELAAELTSVVTGCASRARNRAR